MTEDDPRGDRCYYSVILSVAKNPMVCAYYSVILRAKPEDSRGLRKIY